MVHVYCSKWFIGEGLDRTLTLEST